MPVIHFEAKRCLRLWLYEALEQAQREAAKRLPVVAHRRNEDECLAVMRLSDLLAILRDSDYMTKTETETETST